MRMLERGKCYPSILHLDDDAWSEKPGQEGLTIRTNAYREVVWNLTWINEAYCGPKGKHKHGENNDVTLYAHQRYEK
jgi:hypothetical protein